MTATRKLKKRKQTSGVALLLVLSALLTLSLTFGFVHLANQQNALAMSKLLRQSEASERHLFTADYVLHVARTSGLPDSKTLRIPYHTDDDVRFRDVSGLVDLNASSDELLALLLEAISVEPRKVQEILTHRRTAKLAKKPFLSAGHFARFFDLDQSQMQAIEQFTTVHSGQRGVNSNAASEELLRLLCGCTPASTVEIPNVFHEKWNDQNFQSELTEGATAGAVHAPVFVSAAKTLEF